MTTTPPARRRDRIDGAIALLALACLGIGATALYWPDTGFLGTFGRMFDSLAPQLLALGSLLALWLARPGSGGWMRRGAAGLALLGLAGLTAIAVGHVARAAPPARDAAADLGVIWFNLYANNTTSPDVLAEAILNSGADLVVLGEAAPILPALDRLSGVYPHRLGCITGKVCSTLVLSRLPFAPDSPGMIETSRPGRMTAFRLALPGREALDVVAVHMPKPWFYGFYDVDLWHLLDRDRRATGPLVVMGDFNAAPWSRPLRRIFDETGLMPPRLPVATWPGWAGPFGVPIDQMLVRGGAALEGLEAWGGGLGSNHRGLFARIALP